MDNKTILLPIFFRPKRKEDTTIKELLINEQIRTKEVKLIGEDGTQLGVLPIKEAQSRAYEAGKDLVLMSSATEPYVCKILDYSKWKYEQAKKEKENKKNQKVVKIKEVMLSAVIDVGDMNTRAKQTTKFIEEGNKVKVCIRLKGRQNARPELGIRNMDKFAEMLAEIADVDQKPVLQGREISMLLVPKKVDKK
jgi:translation initiation factor IF-3